MSEKGSSDLDIFDGLAKKAPEPSPAPGRAPPPPSSKPIAKKTLVGLQPAAPPSKGSLPPPPPPPPPRRSAPPPPLSAGRGLGPPPGVPGLGPPPSSNPARAASPPVPGGAGAVEMDWEDDDEKTTVYDKGGNEDAARALLRSTNPPPPVSAPGPPRRPVPSNPQPPPRPPAPVAGPPAPALPPPVRSIPPPAPPTRPINRPPAPPPIVSVPVAQIQPGPLFHQERRTWIYAAVGLIAAAIVALVLFMPRTGSLIVTVSGPGNKPLDTVEIFVNGEKKCSSSPCTISGLRPDTYMLRARAAGHQAMADTAVPVNAGQKTVHNLTLSRATGTGMKVIAEGTGLKLYVDGKEMGPLPQELKDMEPGTHVVKVAGNDRFETHEQTVTIEPDQMQTIGPLKLKVLKGLASIVPGGNAEDARVLLVSGNDRRALPKLPINLDIPTNRQHYIVATKRGYTTFRAPIKFEDGQAEKTIEVTMVEAGAETPSVPVASHRPRSGGGSVAPRAPAPAPAGGNATLNINSIPVSQIVLDGRPLGSTPKIGIKVSAGSHSVVFISGTDRKASSVSVGPGQTKTVAVRF